MTNLAKVNKHNYEVNLSNRSILNFLEKRDPKEKDDFAELVANELMLMRQDIINYVGSYKKLIDVEEFVDETLGNYSYKTLITQFIKGAEAVKMPLSPKFNKNNQCVLKNWVLAIIGKPYSGRNSGKITNAIRKEKRFNLAEKQQDIITQIEESQSFDEPSHIVEQNQEDKCLRYTIEKTLDNEPPKYNFVFRLLHELHDFTEITNESILLLAKQANLDTQAIRSMELVLNKSLTDITKITQIFIGSLVMLGAKQVRNINKRVLFKIRKNLQQNIYEI